jgi:hypothetical protein
VAYLACAAEDAQVVAVAKHRSSPTEHPIHGSSDPGADRLHARRKVLAAHRLDDEVSVIGLNRVVRHPKAASLAGVSKAAFKLAHEAYGAE